MACASTTVTTSPIPSTEAPTATTITPVSTTSVQCILSDWTNWTPCTVTCGQGTQQRFRNIEAGSCTDPLSETRYCQMEPCPCIFTPEIYRSTFQKEPPADSKFIIMTAYDLHMDHRSFRFCWLD